LPNSAADMLPQKLTDVAERGFIRSCAVFRPVPLVHFWLVGSAPLVEPMIGPCVDGKARSAALFGSSGDHLSATSSWCYLVEFANEYQCWSNKRVVSADWIVGDSGHKSARTQCFYSAITDCRLCRPAPETGTDDRNSIRSNELSRSELIESATRITEPIDSNVVVGCASALNATWCETVYKQHGISLRDKLVGDAWLVIMQSAEAAVEPDDGWERPSA
jgi:hypothetical protein